MIFELMFLNYLLVCSFFSIFALRKKYGVVPVRSGYSSN